MRASARDLAGVVHAHLDDCNLVLGLQAQQLQRQAEMIVEIAFATSVRGSACAAAGRWLPW